MAGEVCGDFYNQSLSQALKAAAAVNLYLRLYSNNHTPVLGDVPSNYTEVTVTSYAAVALVQATWTITDTSGVVAATYPQQTFTLGGAVNVYGYYVTDAGKTKVYWAELFAGGPIPYTSAGGSLLLSIEVDGATS